MQVEGQRVQQWMPATGARVRNTYTICPAEVEEVLLAHPAVETAQVIGVPDQRLGEVGCAYVKLKAGNAVSEQELLEWCKTRCANFRVPRYLRIVADFESIGMTASGKVQKTKLRERAEQALGSLQEGRAKDGKRDANPGPAG